MDHQFLSNLGQLEKLCQTPATWENSRNAWESCWNTWEISQNASENISKKRWNEELAWIVMLFSVEAGPTCILHLTPIA